jgi:hypothetical protein
VFDAWIDFTVFCKNSKEKQNEATKAVELFRLKICFRELKNLIVLRANRLKFQHQREARNLMTLFRGFRKVIKKSIVLSESYCEVASKFRKRIAREVLDKWYNSANERISSKHAISIEIEEQRLEDMYISELSTKRKAFESLKINMAPRTKTIIKLVEKYYKEHLKAKTLKAFKTYHSWKINEQTRIDMLNNEKYIAKTLRTPFMNVQMQAYEEDWSMQELNLNTEKVYNFLSYNKKKQVFMAWRARNDKIAYFNE